jgi:hypothetical protein
LLPPKSEAGVQVVALGPDRRTAEVRRKPVQTMDWRGAEEQGEAGK